MSRALQLQLVAKIYYQRSTNEPQIRNRHFIAAILTVLDDFSKVCRTNEVETCA